ncbi:DUF421 domain-containing protein [Serpentinicella alkaliphila]|uniref:Uncharacterized membrane protein YcaP (DUF421 family) n=1 Tax=Serpentinicella alkaliphila TaxID=1734049 RepID=A0A4V2T3I2_9FIRM|nr:DUF421 domain-containing protein [Serpentinicella alkaliphila]QUH27019.1 DUF421 domain-containing protein [Serpentinicella alkaliphila]TCQ01514.1 uncharacterized membrane protein YcaP (DUF421 family) [Serpentinicella alkaliphila]
MINWIEILLRSVILFFTVFILARVVSKKNVGRMTAFNFINYVVIAIIAALISVNIINDIAIGVVALSVWVLLPIVLDFLSLKSKLASNWINGRELILVKNGKVLEDNLKLARLTGEDLLKELRSKEVFSLMNVEFAMMEPSGEINILLKPDNMPITPAHLGVKVNPQTSPQTVILDGNVINESLSNIGLNSNWLMNQLESIGVSLDNVFIGQVDSSGDLYLDLFDDKIQLPQPSVREMLFASLEKSQANLTTFALETQDDDAKQMYNRNVQKLEMIIRKLEPYLMR